MTEDDLNRLGYAVVGDHFVQTDTGVPDDSWELSRLEAYAKGRLARFGHAEQQSILQAEKAAVDLFWAGSALKLIRDNLKDNHRGAWTSWKVEHGLKDTTVNDAIRLFENAKTEDALIGMGITAAKTRFVYPFKEESESRSLTQVTSKGKRIKNRSGGASKAKDRNDQEDGESAGETSLLDGLVTELEKMAQRLNEIAQDEIGKVHWTEADRNRFQTATTAVEAAITKINWRTSDESLAA